MQINPDYNTAAHTIRSYDTGEIVIFKPIPADSGPTSDNNRNKPNATLLTLNESFIIMPATLVRKWEAQSAKRLTKNHFETLMALNPELVIIGTGNKIHFPPTTDYLFLQQQGIGVEIMDTPAACRTYNFLVADGRNVAAGLFMI